MDEVIDELSLFIDITSRDRKRFRRRMEETKRFESIVLKSKLTDEEVARFTVQRYRFPGVEVQARMFRQYPLGEVAAHAIGYIGRISQKDIDRLPEEEETNYQGTTHYGKEGIEKSYERVLHGVTGYEEMEVSASGRAVRTLSTRSTVPETIWCCRLISNSREWSKKPSASGVVPWSPWIRQPGRFSPMFPNRLSIQSVRRRN